MAITLADKKDVVAEVAEIAQRSVSIVAAEYRGLSVNKMTELRRRAREQGVHLQIVRNTLSRRALENTEHACLSDELIGPLFLAFSIDAPSSAARLLRDYAKENDTLKVKAVALGGKLYGAQDIDIVANLPTRDEAISKLMAVMKEPIAKFVRTMAAPTTKLVRVIAAVRDTKN